MTPLDKCWSDRMQVIGVEPVTGSMTPDAAQLQAIIEQRIRPSKLIRRCINKENHDEACVVIDYRPLV